MQKIIFPYRGESSEKMDVQTLCKMLTAMQMNSSKCKRASLGDCKGQIYKDLVLSLMTHCRRLSLFCENL